ncbi:hypothetical protein HD806DRAFT_541657 [Xylariaceae sp. AK1471]|nr:hypothetical protein HD806DRAFT_541657 [Xylariaceae sp. AK1471]
MSLLLFLVALSAAFIGLSTVSSIAFKYSIFPLTISSSFPVTTHPQFQKPRARSVVPTSWLGEIILTSTKSIFGWTVWRAQDMTDEMVYTTISCEETACGYERSDYESATKAGYPAATFGDAGFDKVNKYLHAGDDILDNTTYHHMIEQAKVVI